MEDDLDILVANMESAIDQGAAAEDLHMAIYIAECNRAGADFNLAGFAAMLVLMAGQLFQSLVDEARSGAQKIQ